MKKVKIWFLGYLLTHGWTTLKYSATELLRYSSRAFVTQSPLLFGSGHIEPIPVDDLVKKASLCNVSYIFQVGTPDILQDRKFLKIMYKVCIPHQFLLVIRNRRTSKCKKLTSSKTFSTAGLLPGIQMIST